MPELSQNLVPDISATDANARAKGCLKIGADLVSVGHVDLGWEGDHDRRRLGMRQRQCVQLQRLTFDPGTAAPGRPEADTSRPGTAAGSTTAVASSIVPARDVQCTQGCDLGISVGAGEGNRTLMTSLEGVPPMAVVGAGLRIRVSDSNRGLPPLTLANDTLMARRPSALNRRWL